MDGEERSKRGSAFNCSTLVAFVVILFVCGCISVYYVPQLQPSAPSPATRTPRPRPSPSPVTWILDVPHGATQGLWTEKVLSDESCLDCIIGDLASGTRLEPLSSACQASDWDPSAVYCEVRVLDGDLASATGWVNEQHISK